VAPDQIFFGVVYNHVYNEYIIAVSNSGNGYLIRINFTNFEMILEEHIVLNITGANNVAFSENGNIAVVNGYSKVFSIIKF
jgi:hypothetical protein